MANGMILEAGQGTRVRPLKQKTLQRMVPLLGRPVLECLFEHLARRAIRAIIRSVEMSDGA